MPTNDPQPTKYERRQQAREKALALRKEQERKARRNRIIGISALAVALVALGGVVIAVINSNNQSKANAESYAQVAFPEASPVPSLAAVTAPKTADAKGGIPVSKAGVGTAGSGTRLDVYFDFMCPYCGEFDRTNAADLDALVTAGSLTVIYHPVSFLDSSSVGTYYSTRAANAAAVVADQSPANFTAFVTAMYATGNQPAEGTAGPTDARIAEIAQGVGVPASVTAKFTATATVDGVTARTFAPWLAAVTQLLPTDDQGRATTPAILIDGTRWNGDYTSAGKLKAAILGASQG
jgi:protein-disulfide isomerase